MYNEQIINKIKFLEDQNKLVRVGDQFNFKIEGDLITFTELKTYNTCVDCGCDNDPDLDDHTIYVMDDGGSERVCLCTECLLNFFDPENFDEFAGL